MYVKRDREERYSKNFVCVFKYSFVLNSFSNLFCSILFYSVILLFYSIILLFYYSILFYSIIILLYSILLFID